MSEFVFWEGRVMPVDEARVSVMDAGFLYGDGLYETMRLYSGIPFAFPRHMERLQHGADSIQLPLPSSGAIREGITALQRRTGHESAVVRVTTTRGTLTRRLDLSSAEEPTLLITLQPLSPQADEIRQRGIRVVRSRFVRLSEHPLSGIKSTNYQVSLFARNEARANDADEALLANESGDYVEGAAANVFLVKDGTVVTPPLDTGILGGVTRTLALELAEKLAIPVREETLAPALLESADEVFLTGTTIQIAPVTRIDDSPVGDGAPGRTTQRLQDAYLALVEKEAVPPADSAKGSR